VTRSKCTYSPIVITLAGLGALALPMGVGRFAFTPILPMMQVDVGLSVAAGGWLAAANYVGTLLGALSAMAIRISVPTAIRGGLVLMGLATIAMAYESSIPGWLVLRLLAGFAVGWVLPCAAAWALERLDFLQRPVLNAAVFSGYGVGIAITGGICIVLMTVDANSGRAWALLGTLSLVVTALLWPIFRENNPAGSVERQGIERQSYSWNADSRLLVLWYGLFGFGYIIPATFLPVMARQVIQDPLIFGWAWPIFGLAAAGSTFVAAPWSRAIGNRRLWALGHLVMASGLVLPVIFTGIIAIMVSALLVGSTFTVITMAGFQEGRERGGLRMIAAMASAFAFGQIAGPITVSVVVRTDGNFSKSLTIACLLLIVSAFALLLSHEAIKWRRKVNLI
jgi:MFS family permease